MPGKFLQTLIFLTIGCVTVLFVMSLLNPVESYRKQQDEISISYLVSHYTSSASASCFKPVSQYYKSDPRTIYDAKGGITFKGFWCLQQGGARH